MPMVRVQTSSPVSSDQREALMARLSQTVASALGKPESYMMVVVDPSTPMLMGGDAAPAALVEIRSVGTITAEQATELSAAVSELLEQELGVAAARVYANFAGVPPAMWGMGPRTFG